MRYWLKFGHSMAAMALLGSLAALLVLYQQLPVPADNLEVYAQLRVAMERITTLVTLPSLVASIVLGLLSMAFVSGFHNAPWAWAKLLTGVLMLEGSLLGIQGPIQREATRALAAMSDLAWVEQLGSTVIAEQRSIWAVGAVATVNVILGVWRPRFSARAATPSF